MSGAVHPPHRSQKAATYRARAARRKVYRWRRVGALLVLLTLLVSAYYAANWAITRIFDGPTAAPPDGQTGRPSGTTPGTPGTGEGELLTFVPEQFLPVPGATTDWIAVGPSVGSLRQIALVTGSEKSPRLLGREVTIPDFPLQIGNLPRAQGVLILSGTLPRNGDPTPVSVHGQEALQAAGAEPDYLAWYPDPEQGLVRLDYYAMAAPLTPPAPNSILIDKWMNVLWLYENGQLVQTSRVATGRHLQGPEPSAANQMENFLTPLGRFKVENKLIDPHYYPQDIAGGLPENPLGSRWLGLAVYPDDPGIVWGIHGGIRPGDVGRWTSKGSIQMQTQELEALYDRVPIGTVIEITASEPR